jgi:hypothetical protein
MLQVVRAAVFGEIWTRFQRSLAFKNQNLADSRRSSSSNSPVRILLFAFSMTRIDEFKVRPVRISGRKGRSGGQDARHMLEGRRILSGSGVIVGGLWTT